MSFPHWVDDPTIGDDEILWRRVDPADIVTDHNTGRQRSSSAAFLTEQMSVHIASLTSLEAVLTRYPHVRIAAFGAEDARNLGCVVARAPTPDDPSHALVCRQDDSTKRISKRTAKRLAEIAQLLP